MVAACTRVRGLSLRWRTGEPEHCRGDWPVLVHLGKVTVIKTAVLRVLSGRYDQDDNWDEKIFQKLQISAVILQPNYNPILLNADIATLKQPPPTPAPVSSPSSSLQTSTLFPKSPT